jgi:serine protease Do
MITQGFGEVAERLRRSTARVGGGSGVIWSSDGLIVTNAHVVHDSTVKVSLWDGSAHEAKLLNRDARRDLASIKIEADGLFAAEPADSGSLRVGELVIAIGNPFGFIGALTTGVVHSTPNRKQWVAADVRLAPGNSGGPLADARGRVIGINTMIAGRLALAVPSNAVGEFLARRGASGPKLGVTLQRVPIPGGAFGFLLLKIDPGSAASNASLMVGDLLIAADGRVFTSADDLSAALDSSGEVIELQFLRGDRRSTRETAVRVRARSPEAA